MLRQANRANISNKSSSSLFLGCLINNHVVCHECVGEVNSPDRGEVVAEGRDLGRLVRALLLSLAYGDRASEAHFFGVIAAPDIEELREENKKGRAVGAGEEDLTAAGRRNVLEVEESTRLVAREDDC